MHQLALALQRQGYTVSGSDDEINDPAKSNLAAAGLLPPQFGWDAAKITKNIDAVVLGMSCMQHGAAGYQTSCEWPAALLLPPVAGCSGLYPYTAGCACPCQVHAGWCAISFCQECSWRRTSVNV